MRPKHPQPHLVQQIGITVCFLAVAIVIGRVWGELAGPAVIGALVASALMPLFWPDRNHGAAAQRNRAVQLPAQRTEGEEEQKQTHQRRSFRGTRPGFLVVGIEDIADERFIKAAHALQGVRLIEPGVERQLPLVDQTDPEQTIIQVEQPILGKPQRKRDG